MAVKPGDKPSLVSTVRDWWPHIEEWPFWARESIRKLLHIGVVALALPLRWFGWWYGIIFAALALFWNAFGMPRFFHFTLREEEVKSGYSRGMLSYPVTVLCLIILFPLPVAVSQWATLSFGDGFATLVGRFLGKRPLPWNRQKTVEGMGAFVVMGTLGSLFFFLFTLTNIHQSSFLWEGSLLLDHIVSFSIPEVIFICAASTFVAAFFESLPLPYVDDNVVAPIAGALVKLGLCFVL